MTDNCKSCAKYFTDKVVIFTVQSSIYTEQCVAIDKVERQVNFSSFVTNTPIVVSQNYALVISVPFVLKLRPRKTTGAQF